MRTTMTGIMTSLTGVLFGTTIARLENSTSEQNIRSQSIALSVGVAVTIAILGSVLPFLVIYHTGPTAKLLWASVLAAPVFAGVLSLLAGISTMQAYQELTVEAGVVHGMNFNVEVELQEEPAFSMTLTDWFDRQLYEASIVGLIGVVVTCMLAVIAVTKAAGMS